MHQTTQLLPMGIQSFEKLRDRNCIYVDKTAYIYRLVHDASLMSLSFWYVLNFDIQYFYNTQAPKTQCALPIFQVVSYDFGNNTKEVIHAPKIIGSIAEAVRQITWKLTAHSDCKHSFGICPAL